MSAQLSWRYRRWEDCEGRLRERTHSPGFSQEASLFLERLPFPGYLGLSPCSILPWWLSSAVIYSSSLTVLFKLQAQEGTALNSHIANWQNKDDASMRHSKQGPWPRLRDTTGRWEQHYLERREAQCPFQNWVCRILNLHCDKTLHKNGLQHRAFQPWYKLEGEREFIIYGEHMIFQEF